MATSLARATYTVSPEGLPHMVLQAAQLGQTFSGFRLVKEGELDNATMAEHGFPGNTAESFVRLGRITGYMREFVSPSAGASNAEGDDLMAATVVHLFDGHEAVSRWIADMFVAQFMRHVGQTMAQGHTLLAAEPFSVEGFHDAAKGIRALQRGPGGLISSTIVDLKVGRVLGVSFVVSAGDVDRKGLACQVALELERQIVRVALT